MSGEKKGRRSPLLLAFFLPTTLCLVRGEDLRLRRLKDADRNCLLRSPSRASAAARRPPHPSMPPPKSWPHQHSVSTVGSTVDESVSTQSHSHSQYSLDVPPTHLATRAVAGVPTELVRHGLLSPPKPAWLVRFRSIRVCAPWWQARSLQFESAREERAFSLAVLYPVRYFLLLAVVLGLFSLGGISALTALEFVEGEVVFSWPDKVG
jgi:hypothetical protein